MSPVAPRAALATRKPVQLAQLAETPKPITLTLTFPPSANRLWRNFGGRSIKSAEYRDWIALNERLLIGVRFATIAGHYRLTILATAPDKRRRDLTNLEKASSDFLQHAKVVADDCNCRELRMAWADGPGAGVTCTIEPMGVS